MAGELFVSVRVEWISVDPDGSLCECCGDMCMLSMFRLSISVGSNGDIGSDCDVVLCRSCHDAITED